ncbi:MAG: methyltransferase domain-containing protein [Nitrospiraceae bacterium]
MKHFLQQAARSPWLAPVRALVHGRRQEASVPSVGSVRFGDLRRLTPISSAWGFDRGLPIDRHYIERFLTREAPSIAGCVLEIGDNSYTRRFGGASVTVSDVLHVTPGTPQATIIGDLTHADHIPTNRFDCIILTQTLQLIYDVHAAIRTLFRILKPGGVVLATVPGITPISDSQWSSQWCWNFTRLSAARLFQEQFPPSCVRVDTQGNLLSALAFLQGLAAQELSPEELAHTDERYDVTITVKAVKPIATEAESLESLRS